MQWFMPTTKELRDRIEQMYRFDGALTQLKAVTADVESIRQKIESDLSPTKVQHEMRLNALEQLQLLERIDAQNRALGGLQAALTQQVEENNRLRQELTSLKNLLSTKYDVVQVEIEEIKTKQSEAADQSAEIEVLQQLLEGLQNQKPQPSIDPTALDELRAEVNQLWQLFADRVEAIEGRLDAKDALLSEIVNQIEQILNRGGSE